MSMSMPQDCSVRRLLLSKLKELASFSRRAPGTSLVVLRDTATVEQALKVFADHRILSAPVVIPEEGDASQAAPAVRWPVAGPDTPPDIQGFVCVADVLQSFLALYAHTYGSSLGGTAADGHRSSGAGGADAGGASMLARMRRLEELGQRFAQQQLRDLTCKGCDGDFLHSRHAGEATLLELVMYGFLDPKRRGMHEGELQSRVVHRVALFDTRGRITSVISQSDIVAFLAAHAAELGHLGGATVEELGWDRKPPLSVTPDTPALDAMRLMVAAGVSSLAVVEGPPHAHANHANHAHANHDAAAAPNGGGHGNTSSSGSSSSGSGAAACHDNGSSGSGSGQAAAHAHANGGAASAAPAGEERAAAAAAAGGSGRLLGNFSASEMRTMTAEHFGAMALPVGEFLALEHCTEYMGAAAAASNGGGGGSACESRLEEGVRGSAAHEFTANRSRRARPHTPGEEVGQHLVVVRRSTTFAEVVELLVRHRIHRLYVTDEQEVPRGIVTCTDVLRAVVEVATAPSSPVRP